MMKRSIIAYAGARSDHDFFVRFVPELRRRGLELVLLTNKPSLMLRSAVRRIPCFLIHNAEPTGMNPVIDFTTDILSRSMKREAAELFFAGMMECLERIKREWEIEGTFIWNGSTLATTAVSVFAGANDIHTLYFELSNVPGRIFADPVGVNAQSRLFLHPEVVEEYPIGDEVFAAWREEYLSSKRRETTTDQARRSVRIQNILFPIDAASVALLDLPSTGEMNVIPKLRMLRSGNSVDYPYDQYDLVGNEYNFFPMQLSYDSQLLLNSTVTLQEAIDRAYEASRREHRDLLIKPHPVEDMDTIAPLLRSLRERTGIFIVQYPTMQIVELCRRVFTINSTVGLEGMIAAKEVTFFGHSFYPLLTGKRLKQYILGYLIDIDYYSNDSITEHQMNLLWLRMVSR